MPSAPTTPPHDRFFARLERFQCACPSCGRVLLSTQDQGTLSKHLLADGEKPPSQKYLKRARTVKAAQQLVWNPYTQRLTCPWCRTAYVAGLLLFPTPGGKQADAPPDTRPTRSERMERARIAGGYHLQTVYRDGQDVNLAVTATCSCPPKGWVVTCPVHGTPEKAHTAETEEDPRGGGE
jgi:hypothetical protein